MFVAFYVILWRRRRLGSSAAKKNRALRKGWIVQSGTDADWLRDVVRNFLGPSPSWYNKAIVACLIVNPIVFAIHPYAGGWLLVAEFIGTLALALRCYPLAPGGLLAIEAVAIGMTSPGSVFDEVRSGFEVILLLIFMVAGIHFLKDLLLFTFTKLLVNVRSKIALSLLFSGVAAVLSAFLDALTVIAVVITVASGFYGVYHRVASGKPFSQNDHDVSADGHVVDHHREDLAEFRACLRSLVMHAAVGTALGGVTTLVGEPQNLLIATRAGWDFVEFFVRTAPVSLPVLAAGLVTCVALERLRWFGYGAVLPGAVRKVIEDYDASASATRTSSQRAMLVTQGIIAVVLVVALAFHWAAVGLIGLTVIVLATAFTGVTDEHRLGHAFHEALPFTALLVVFFAVVAVIHDQQLFDPLIHSVLAYPPAARPSMFFVVTGALSAISDNVFVATVYINEALRALESGAIGRAEFEILAVAINTGTNIPSVATPNGQAAFLFLLTSALAPLIRLSYAKMAWMALPYTIVMTATALVAVMFWLPAH
jgi:NhaB family Na+:H+ antiporter